MVSRKLAMVILAFVTLIAGAIVAGKLVYKHWLSPKKVERIAVLVEVRRGDIFLDVAMRLKGHGIIDDIDDFVELGREKSAVGRIQVGEFVLYTGDPYEEILKTLVEGQAQRKFTVPEGYNLNQIAAIFQKAGICSRERFLAAAKEKGLMAKIDPGAKTLEGYLFPATYQHTRSDTVSELLEVMVNRFKTAFSPEMENRAKDVGMTMREVVTLASIVEKETSKADERPLIARVFWNRINKKMRLMSDPTVIYGIKDFDGNLRKADLKRPGPYNTYILKGLPPGPIANPGLESMKAALWPAEGAWLYFVANNEGGHVFSKTYREHVNAVNKYQKRRRGTR